VVRFELAEAKYFAASFCKNAALLYPGLPKPEKRLSSRQAVWMMTLE
jgi:hypothetical protein